MNKYIERERNKAEAAFLRRLLSENDFSVPKVAEILEMGISPLYRRMKRLKITIAKSKGFANGSDNQE